MAACILFFSSSSSAISVMSEKSTASDAFVSKSEKTAKVKIHIFIGKI